MRIKVYHNGKEINWRIPKDSFPDIGVSFKGDGYYDFEVEPVSFKINSNGLSLNVNDEILITDVSGNVLVNGYIDEIGDELSNPVEVTVYPQALKLKDIIAGDEVILNEDTENEETAVEYDTSGYKSLLGIVKDLALKARTETGWCFTANESSVPAPANTNKSYFGNILSEIIRGKLRLMDDSMHFRGKDGVLYLVKIDSGFVMQPLLEKGQWISRRMQIPGQTIDLGITKIECGSWLDMDLCIPPVDINVPSVGAYYDVYRCEHGGLTFIERITWIKGKDLNEILGNSYGEELSEQEYTNVTRDQISSILSELGLNLEEIYSVINTDSFNTYALVKAHEKTNDIFGRDLLLSLETANDFCYQAYYQNKSIMDILKDLAVVSDRYLYIDPQNVIYLLPRDENLGQVAVVRKKVLQLEKSTSNIDEISVSVNRYTEDDSGEPSSYGIRLRDNEWSAIESRVQDKYSGQRVAYSWQLLNPPVSLGLMKEIIMDGTSYGTVINIKHQDNIAEFTTEVFNV